MTACWRRRCAAIVALGCSAAVWAAPAPVRASAAAQPRPFHTVFQDDDLSLFSTRGLGDYMRQLRWLGVDFLRISAEWKLEVPHADARVAPPGFEPGNPNAYVGPGMSLLDRAVRAASAAGLAVMIDPAFSAPLWATRDHLPAQPRAADLFNTSIDVGEAATWEQMLARRYSGTYVPPGARSPLPRVGAFTLWNEPNDHAFLTPQWRGGVPVSADWLRALAQLAYPAIKRVSPGVTVLIGNTAESGASSADPSRGVAPLTFIRRLACVDTRLRPVHDGACARFRTVPADGYAHHPYERDAFPWDQSGPGQSGWVQMGDLVPMQALIEKLVALRRLAPGAVNLWLTEQGYESNAELTDRPWSESEQARLNAASEYIAWRIPQVVSFSQFLLRDARTQDTLAERTRTGDAQANLPGTWTTGLEREDGVAKSALWMFRSPLVAREVPARASLFAAGLPGLISPSAPSVLELWGRLRPARRATRVQVQLRSDLRHSFQSLATVETDANGVFDTTVGPPPDSGVVVRFRWLDPTAGWQASPEVVPTSFPVP